MSPPAPPESAVGAPSINAFVETEYFAKIQSLAASLPDASPADAGKIGHSGPQGRVEPLSIIDDPADWKAADLKPGDYTEALTDAEVAEVIAGTGALLARGFTTEERIKQLTRADFEAVWPTLPARIRALADTVSNGRGFQIITRFPVTHFAANRPGLVVAFWGLALVLGRAQISQTDLRADGSVFGSTFNHITVGRHTEEFMARNSYTHAGDANALEFHSDQGATDLIALLSIAAAREGGESLLVSTVAIHNELLRRGRKDLVEVLSTPGIWWTAKQTDQRAALAEADGTYPGGFEETQPFEYHDGYLSTHFSARKYGVTGKELTPLQQEAVWTVAAIANDPAFHLRLSLQPGDIELIHNPSTLHSRTRVVDAENRHLVRWWVHSDTNRRPIAPHYAPRSNVGPVGGFLVPDYPDLSKQRLPLYPYSRHDGQGQSAAE